MRNIICLVGKTGTGKTTIEEAIVKTELFNKIVSVTTRPKRDGEVEGRDYYFITEERYKQHESAGDFIETKEHFNTKYGVFKTEIEKAKKLPTIFVVDFEGYKEMKKKFPNNVKLFYIHSENEKRISAAIKRGTPGLKERIEEENSIVDVKEISKEWDKHFKNEFTPESLNDIVMSILSEEYTFFEGRNGDGIELPEELTKEEMVRARNEANKIN